MKGYFKKVADENFITVEFDDTKRQKSEKISYFSIFTPKVSKMRTQKDKLFDHINTCLSEINRIETDNPRPKKLREYLDGLVALLPENHKSTARATPHTV